MRSRLDTDLMLQIADKLGIDISGAEPYKILQRISAYHEEISYSFSKILEDETIPERFKKEDVTAFAVFIKEKFDEAIARAREEARNEREAKVAADKEFQIALTALRIKAIEIQPLLEEANAKAKASGKHDATTTISYWNRFRESIGA